MKQPILISVVIPTFNSSGTIRRALDSIMAQRGINDRFRFEVLICDDCSFDRTLNICRSYSHELSVHGFVNPFHTGGPNKGRNTGIQNANGEIIAFLDHDDEWLPEKTITQLTEIEHGEEFIYSSSITRKG